MLAMIIPVSGQAPGNELPGAGWGGAHPDQGLPGGPPNIPHVPTHPIGEPPPPPSINPVPPPVWPGVPVHPLPPERPPGVPPETVWPPAGGEVWPPLPPNIKGKLLALVAIMGVGHRWVVLDADVRPPVAPK